MPFPTLHPSLERALAQKGYREPTPVQSAVVQEETIERDLLVSAQTGSGKTVAYGVALASTLLGDELTFSAPAAPLALIIAPTRELAMQVQSELSWLYTHTKVSIAASIGGMDIRREMRALDAGCHIVVGTPGRLRDHLEHGRLDVTHLRALVLDEADEMLNLGFREDLEFILDATPAERRTLLFSATIPRDIVSIAKRYQKSALRIDMIDQDQPHSDIDYRAVLIAPNEIELAVVNLLRFYESTSAIIFCKTREAVRHLQTSLTERGFLTVALSGEYSQNERTHALQSLRNGRARVCVATDVAARGIDLPGLDLVIHAELPNDRDTLLHRSGRTGRAGRKGMSIVLVPFNRRRKAELLVSKARIDIEWGNPPSLDDIRLADQQRMKDDPLFTLPTTVDEDEIISQLMRERSAQDIAGAFVRLYRSRLPSAEDICVINEHKKRPVTERGTERDMRQESPRFKDQPRSTEPMQWFRMRIGRKANADPKWIIPLICRRGHITKKDIGLIKIFDTDTKFEIAQSVAAHFASHIRRDDEEDNIIIEPTQADHSTPSAPKKHRHKPRDHHADERRKDSAHKDSAHKERGQSERPHFAKSKNAKGKKYAPSDKPQKGSAPPPFRAKKKRPKPHS